MSGPALAIGRIVRYVPNALVDAQPEWPAIITQVLTASLGPDPATPGTTVDLMVFRLKDVVAARAVPYLGPETATEGEGRGHTWHWPPR